MARADFQTVRTTAYTDTEADHLAYTNHNALGGILHAASIPAASVTTMVAAAGPIARPESESAADFSTLQPVSNDAPRARPVTAARAAAAARPTPGTTYLAAAARQPAPPRSPATAPTHSAAPAARPASAAPDGNPPWMAEYLRRKKLQEQENARASYYVTTPSLVRYAAAPPSPQVCGSAAADWSRWPVGTRFRIQSTGQIYQVDDYGWALAGRNTIDLYHASKADMNAWGVRHEPIQILAWGSREESLRLLRHHQEYKHIRRMVLELEGHESEAAELE